MVASVVQPRNQEPQLITRRKVGTPAREGDSNQPQATTSRKSAGSQQEQNLPEIQLYDANPQTGLTLNSFTRTGQYLDTYA